MTKFKEVPKRMYCEGDKKLISIRLPEKLLKELEKIARDRQWAFSDIVATALDEYVQWSSKNNN